MKTTRTPKYFVYALLTGFLLLLAACSQAPAPQIQEPGIITQASTTIAFNDFSDVSDLTLNGNAAQAGNFLRLVPAASDQAGSAYLTAPVQMGSFESRFEFLLHNTTGQAADGLTFVIQSQGLNALGRIGGQLGYKGLFDGIHPSVAVFFDLDSGCGQKVGVAINNSTVDGCPAGLADAPFNLSGSPVTVWVDYDEPSTTLQVFMAQDENKPAAPLFTSEVDIKATVGASAFVGFTAGTGANYADNDILNWTANLVPADSTPPTASPSQSPAANAASWNNMNVSVNWNWSDSDTGIDTSNCTTPSTSTGEGSITLTATCKDNAGNEGSASYTVKVDKTAPAIAFVSRTAANGAGWNNSDVTLTWSCSDETSGVVNASVSQTVSSEGADQSSAGTCEDLAGNSVSDTQANINIDKTAPSLNPVVSPNPVLLNGSATVSSGTSDSLSGLASQSCGSPDTSSVGSKSVSCSATDNAGNSASASASYNVIYNFRGFFLPVQNAPALNGVKAGWVVPFSFNLGGNFGRNVITSTVSVPINCSTLAPQGNATATQQGSSVSQTSEQALSSWGLSSNLTSNNLTASSSTSTLYVYVWNTDKSWKNTCRQFSMTLNDGTQHKANFKFK